MKILLARQNKDSYWVQVASNLQQNPSSEEARKIIKNYLSAGYELCWSTLDNISINNGVDEDVVWNEIEDSQNKNLLGS